MKNNQLGFNLLYVLLILALGIGGAVGWRYYERHQAEERQRVARAEQQKALAALETVLGKWIDAAKLAGSTSRVALAQPVASLQSLKREAEGIFVPSCLDPAKLQLVTGMQLVVDGFIKFMANDYALEAIKPEDLFISAAERLKVYHQEKSRCSP